MSENTGKKIKILFIDSDQMMRIYFRDIFWIHGYNDKYEINLASSLLEANNFLSSEENKPDLIFLDSINQEIETSSNLEEKIHDSISFVKKIRENKDFSSVKIVIFSSNKDKKVEKAFSDLGVSGYMLKGELMPKEIISFVDKIYE